jgi:hypothetical protein
VFFLLKSELKGILGYFFQHRILKCVMFVTHKGYQSIQYSKKFLLPSLGFFLLGYPVVSSSLIIIIKLLISHMPLTFFFLTTTHFTHNHGCTNYCFKFIWVILIPFSRSVADLWNKYSSITDFHYNLKLTDFDELISHHYIFF